MDLNLELKVAKSLAKIAGSIALKHRNTLKVFHKANGEGAVTNADLEIDDLICSSIKTNFPSDKIISEESYKEEKDFDRNGRVWFIDPIDGTANYILGQDDFVVMIALAIDGIASLGVIYQPVTDIMWWGIVTKEHKQAQKITASGEYDIKIDPFSKANKDIKLIISRSYQSKKQQMLIDELRPKTLIRRSSLGLKGMLILEKEADLYVGWSKSIKLWDTCAPAVIIHAAHGYMAHVDERHFDYRGPINHGSAIFASNFMLDARLSRLLKEIAGS